eukprot:2466444-Rhodomonas_salina.1
MECELRCFPQQIVEHVPRRAVVRPVQELGLRHLAVPLDQRLQPFLVQRSDRLRQISIHLAQCSQRRTRSPMVSQRSRPCVLAGFWASGSGFWAQGAGYMFRLLSSGFWVLGQSVSCSELRVSE